MADRDSTGRGFRHAIRCVGKGVTRRAFLQAMGMACLGVTLGGCGKEEPGAELATTATETAQPTVAPATVTPTVTETPTPEATATPRPTDTPPATATAKPTATPEPTATPTPETLTIVDAPKVEGLKAVVEDGKVVYRAEAGNKYGLEKETLAAIYYPEAYLVGDSVETAKRVGAVGICKEVERYYLQQAGSPQKAILWALPFDFTFASQEAKLLVQQINNSYNGNDEIFLSVPVDSVLVNPLEVGSDGLDVWFSQQSWGTVIEVGYPGIFSDARYPQNKFSLKINFAGRLENQQVRASLGQELVRVGGATFSSDMIAFLNKYREPAVMAESKVQIFGQSYFETDGKFPTIGMSLENILRFGNSFAFILSNDNPLLK